MHTFGFILEQGLGHRTHSLNLQANVPKDRSVHAIWKLVEHQTAGWMAAVPLLNRNWTLEAGLQSRWAIAKMQRQQPVDALFFHTQVPAVLATKWLKRIPSIVSLDATPLQYDALGAFYNHEQGATWLEEQKWRLNRNCFHHAHHLVAWSQWAKAGLVAEYEVSPEKVTVIPPGIAITDWQRSQPRRLEEMQTGETPVKILFVGGDLKRKGGLDLIDAFRVLRNEFGQTHFGQNKLGARKCPPIELHLVTKDDLPGTELTSDRQIAEPGLYLHQGMQPNSSALKALFHTCDIFCLPTYGDCLPLSLIEASAASLPSITTRVGGTAEAVTDGETGFLLPVGDQSMLVDRLRLLIENPRLRLQQGVKAGAVAKQRFDAEQTTGQILTLLKAATRYPVRFNND